MASRMAVSRFASGKIPGVVSVAGGDVGVVVVGAVAPHSQAVSISTMANSPTANSHFTTR